MQQKFEVTISLPLSTDKRRNEASQGALFVKFQAPVTFPNSAEGLPEPRPRRQLGGDHKLQARLLVSVPKPKPKKKSRGFPSP